MKISGVTLIRDLSNHPAYKGLDLSKLRLYPFGGKCYICHPEVAPHFIENDTIHPIIIENFEFLLPSKFPEVTTA